MASQGPTNTTPSPLPGAVRRRRSDAEHRISRRCKITQVMRIRPSDPERDNFEDVRGTVSVSRSGVYFHTGLESYELGMRLFVTVPYTNDPTAVGHEYLAEVVRLDRLVSGAIGVGLKLLLEIGLHQTFVEETHRRRK